MSNADDRQAAWDLRNRGEFAQAAAACGRVLAVESDDIAMSACRGYCRYQLGDYGAVLEDYSAVLRRQPDHVEARKYRGAARIWLGRFAEAIEDLNRAIELDPSDPESWRDRGQARRESGDVAGALADYSQAIDLRPDFRRAYWGRGITRRTAEDHAGAVADFSRCLELDAAAADVVDVLANRAWSLRKLDRNAEARDDLTRVLESDPRRANDFWLRGNCHLSLGDSARALADYRRATELQPELHAQLDETIRSLSAESPVVPDAPPTIPAAAVATAPPNPAPQAASFRSKNPLEIIGVTFGIIVIAGLALTFLSLAGFAVVKATDVIASTWYKYEHQHDVEAFPPDAEFCKGLYCRRTDTVQKHVAGAYGRQSELSGFYCPEHERSVYLFFLNLSIWGDMCWFGYCGCVAACTALWYAAALGLPVGLVLAAATPAIGVERRRRWFAHATAVCLVIGSVAAAASVLSYVWW